MVRGGHHSMHVAWLSKHEYAKHAILITFPSGRLYVPERLRYWTLRVLADHLGVGHNGGVIFRESP